MIEHGELYREIEWESGKKEILCEKCYMTHVFNAVISWSNLSGGAPLFLHWHTTRDGKFRILDRYLTQNTPLDILPDWPCHFRCARCGAKQTLSGVDR